MSTRPVFVCFAALLAACAPMEWQKPGVDGTTQARDVDGCRRQARERSLQEINTRVYSQPYGTGIDPRGNATLAPPLAAEGDRAMMEQSLMQSCMSSLGYVLAPRAEHYVR
jgi:hypothetical protein